MVQTPSKRPVYRAPAPRRRSKKRSGRFSGGFFYLLLFLFSLLCFTLCGRFLLSVAPRVAEALTPSFFARKTLLQVDFLGQGEYPTGCESVTSVMALRHAGYSLSVDDFIDGCLPLGEYYEEDGVVWGDDPNQYFVGDPRSSSGFGCFAPVIRQALARVAGEEQVLDLTGSSLKNLCRDQIDQGRPVILWATIEMQAPREGRSWRLISTGEDFTWTAREHCLLLVGYDRDCYYFNDPYKDKGLTAYQKSLVESRYEQLGSQALAVLPA